MNVQEIVTRAKADGLVLVALPDGIQVRGDQSAINRWSEVLKANKPAIIAILNFESLDLDSRIRAMAGRWEYPDELLETWLDMARADPVKSHNAVSLDERSFGIGSDPIKLPLNEAH